MLVQAKFQVNSNRRYTYKVLPDHEKFVKPGAIFVAQPRLRDIEDLAFVEITNVLEDKTEEDFTFKIAYLVQPVVFSKYDKQLKEEE